MRIHAIIHAPFEKLGVIENWISANNHSLSTTHTYHGEQLPNTSAFDFLIIMGGPQSPLRLDKYPYIGNEIELAKQTIKNNKPLLGICLGAQIIAEALGAKTEHSPNKEIGAYPIEVTNAGLQDPLFKLFPAKFEVMHWHNDMPGVGEGSVVLAKSEGCPRQAFCYGDRTYGFQFHLEMTAELIKEMVNHCPEDLLQGKFVRSKEELLSTDYQLINDKMLVVLDYLATKVTNISDEYSMTIS
jgi:GMP synthase (glutamine-hydrolysing)